MSMAPSRATGVWILRPGEMNRKICAIIKFADDATMRPRSQHFPPTSLNLAPLFRVGSGMPASPLLPRWMKPRSTTSPPPSPTLTPKHLDFNAPTESRTDVSRTRRSQAPASKRGMPRPRSRRSPVDSHHGNGGHGIPGHDRWCTAPLCTRYVRRQAVRHLSVGRTVRPPSWLAAPSVPPLRLCMIAGRAGPRRTPRSRVCQAARLRYATVRRGTRRPTDGASWTTPRPAAGSRDVSRHRRGVARGRFRAIRRAAGGVRSTGVRAQRRDGAHLQKIRPAFRYERSLDILMMASGGLVTKSNLILGMGETARNRGGHAGSAR